MITVTESQLLEIVNNELKKLPNYFDGLRVGSVKKEGHVFAFYAEGLTKENNQVDNEKLKISNELINTVIEYLKLNSTYEIA